MNSHPDRVFRESPMPSPAATSTASISADQALVESTIETTVDPASLSRDVLNYLGVLDSAPLTVYGAQTLVGIKAVRHCKLVTLYKALGGGWSFTVTECRRGGRHHPLPPLGPGANY